MTVYDFNQAFEAEARAQAEAEQAKPTGEAKANPEPFDAEAMDLAALEGLDPPPREWAWDGWMPHARAVYFTGDGGIGKSLLMQQLGTAYGLGHALFGYGTRGGPLIGIWGEDDKEEIWRRQKAINARLGCTMMDLVKADICWIPTARDITMFKADGTDSGFKVMLEFERFVETMARRKPGLAIVDGLTLVYEGGEGSRALITRVMRCFDAVAREYGCTIVLIGHNNKGGSFSGSSAFENAVRARMSLSRVEAADGEEVIRFALPKANYSGKATIDLQWCNGCFVAVSEQHMTGEEKLERDMRRSQAEGRFLEGIDKLTKMGKSLSTSNRAQNYAPKLINQHHCPLFSVTELDAAMWRLLEDGRIAANAKLPFKSSGRRWATGLGLPGQEPVADQPGGVEDPAQSARPVQEPAECEAA
jgi:AAA domain